MKILNAQLLMLALLAAYSFNAMAENCVVYTKGCVENRKDEFIAAWKSVDSLYKEVKSCQEYQSKISKIKEIRDNAESYYNTKKDHANESNTEKEKGLTYQEGRDKLYDKSSSIHKILKSLVETSTTSSATQNYGGGNEYTLSSTSTDYPCTKGSSSTATASGSSSGSGSSASGSGSSSDDGGSCSDSDMTKKYKFCKKKYVCKEWELAD